MFGKNDIRIIAREKRKLSEQTDKEINKMEKVDQQKKPNRVSKGLLLAFLSGLGFSCVTLLVKYIKNIHPGQLVLYRYWAMASACFPHLVFSNQNIFGPRGRRTSIIIHAIVSTISIFFHFFAFRYLPLGVAAVIVSSYPAVVTFAARCFLKESFNFVQLISLLATIVGMILTAGTFQSMADNNSTVYTQEKIYGFAAAIMALFGMSTALILRRQLRNINPSVTLFSIAYVGVLEFVVITPLVGNFSLHYCGLQQVLIILLGCLSYLVSFFIVLAMKYAEAGPVTTMVASSDIFLSFIWQVVIFRDVPDTYTVAGAILVVISVVLVGFNKRLNDILCKKLLRLCC